MASPSTLRAAFTTADRRRLARALSRKLPARVYRRLAAVLAIALLARDPRALGYQSTTWAAALLATHCAEHFDCGLHPRTLSRRLHALGFRWKRPRYCFVHRAPHLAQKKGLSDAGSVG